MNKLSSSIFVSNSSNGRGGGPLTTYPCLSKTPLWQGLKNCSRSAIQRARRRAADVIAYDVEMSIMAGTDVMLNVRMPADPTGEMSANVREYANIFLGLAQNKYAVTQACPFPAVYLGAREFEQRGNPKWIFINWAEVDNRFIFRFAK